MLEKEVLKLLAFAGVKTDESKLERPTQKEFGDIAFPCFELAKIERRNPVEIARNLQSKIKIPADSVVERIEANGGYVNFFYNYSKFSEKVLLSLEKRPKNELKEKILVEFSHPNPVHAMHIGHARGTFLGDSLCSIFDYLGYKVVRANLMNDVGLQVAKLVVAYEMWAKNKKIKGKPDFWLWQYYVKFHEEAKIKPELEEKAHEMLRKFEIIHDKKVSAVWNKVVRLVMKGFEETYKKLGLKFDVYFFESDYRKSGKKLVERALKKKLAFKSSEGAIVTNLEKYGIPNTVLLRSDGTGLYITSDLGMTVYRFEKYNLDKSVWVVSSQQNLYFKQLFKLLELLGFNWAKNCYHFSFEHINLPEGKMSSREGRALMLDEVIAKIVEMAKEEVAKRNKSISEKEKQKLAEQIGIGALKYTIVRIEPENLITFDWKQMLSFDGNTGPYIQYAHTRCNSILKKAKKWKKVYAAIELKHEEKNLISTLARFNDIVAESAAMMKPHLICNYLYDLTTALNNFYEKCPVLKAESSQQKNFRLTLVDATKEVLKQGMQLVGMEAPERM